jgi:RP/EB family microtubule-associated protein
MKMNMDTLEKERDFYFGKLRDIEMLLQAQAEQNPAGELILKILYASEEEKIVISESGGVQVLPINGEAKENKDVND